MGITPATILALSASGSIGKTVTATRWRSCRYVRQYSKPSSSVTPAQQEVRDLFSIGLRAWQTEFNLAQCRIDWDRLASYQAENMSGYNLYKQAAFFASKTNVDTVFIKSYYLDGDHISFQGAALSGIPMPAVSQGIDLWMGYNPWSQDFWGHREFHDGLLWSPTFPGPGTYYIRLTSNCKPIGGLIRIQYQGI